MEKEPITVSGLQNLKTELEEKTVLSKTLATTNKTYQNNSKSIATT